MGSLKKKFAKTLRKVTPKEIAPILPFLAMAIPGMQGLSPLLKFALPQLLTAAGSARQTGKINLMNQAMAGIGSLSAMNATNAAAANTTAATAAGEGANYIDALGNVAGATEGMNATQLAAAQKTAEAAALTNNATSAANTMAAQSGIGNKIANSALFNNSFTQPFGTAINNPGFNLPYAMAVGGSGGSLAAADYAGKKQLEFDEEEAAGIASIGNYRDARGALTDYFANQNYSLEDLYGVGNVPSFLAANGGRAKLAGGGNKKGGRRSSSAAGENTNADSASNSGDSGDSGNGGNGGNGGGYQTGNNASANTNANTNANANAGGNGNSQGLKNPFVGPIIDPSYDPSFIDSNNYKSQQMQQMVNMFDPLDLSSSFNPNIDDDDDGLGLNQIGVGNGVLTFDGNPLKKEIELQYKIPFAEGGRTGFSEGSDPDMDRVTELELQGFSYEQAFEIAMKELMNRADGGRIGFSQDYNQGGRVPYNNGGIMQAPGVPSGMELDYRSSGGFIPMGGPEKADDVPAMLSKNEFVMTADAVRAMGNGDVDSGAQKMYDMMNNLEAQV